MPKVTRFSVGDEVYGVGRGSFAEYAVAREDKLAHKPTTLSFEQAAVVPISAGTALQALTDHGRIEAGQRVLVIGASGGVGSYAVQLAKALGAEVTAVASAAKLDLVRSLGADHVLDYTRDDYADGTHHYDLILDIAGNPKLSRLRRALTPRGTAVLVGGEDGGDLTGGMNRPMRALVLSLLVRQRLVWFVAKERASDLDRMSDLFEGGRLKPSIDRTYPWRRRPTPCGTSLPERCEERSLSPSDAGPPWHASEAWLVGGVSGSWSRWPRCSAPACTPHRRPRQDPPVPPRRWWRAIAPRSSARE